MSAPVRGNMLLTTYDCIDPLGDYEFYIESGGQVIELTLWSADPWMNLAVLKADEALFTPRNLGDGAAIAKGQTFTIAKSSLDIIANRTTVAEIGLKLRSNPTVGTMSVHEYGDLVGVKAPAPLMPGAPLLNAKGAVELLATGLQSASPENLSLCIPVDQAFSQAITALISGAPQAYGFLGLEPASLSELPKGKELKGVYVRQVTDHSPAKLANLREENPRTGEIDVITKVNEKAIETPEQLLSAVGRLPFGEKVQLTVRRGKIGEEHAPFQVECTLAKRFANPARPIYSQKLALAWRGLTVDHFTAIDDFSARARLVDPEGCVVIAKVDVDSSAWKAGLRRGMFISKINDRRIKNEADFEEWVNSISGAAKVVTTSRPDGLRLEPQSYELAP